MTSALDHSGDIVHSNQQSMVDKANYIKINEEVIVKSQSQNYQQKEREILEKGCSKISNSFLEFMNQSKISKH